MSYSVDNSVGEAFAKLQRDDSFTRENESRFDAAISPASYYGVTETPTETSGSSTAGGTVLSFPSDIENVKYFITFTFYKDNYRGEYFNRPEKDITGRIRMPMPSALVETFNMGYSGQSLGTVFGYLASTGVPNDIVNILKNTNKDTIETIVSNASNVGARMKEDIANPNTLIAGIRYALSKFTDSGARVLDVATGTALNPYHSLFFDGPELRNHNFSFRLSPNSEKESITLKNIIKTFKLRMHPEIDGLLFKYPDTCIIELSSRVNSFPLYTLYRSVLKGMSVNYAPNNVPSFFKNGIDPVEVALELNFAEIQPITRRDIEDIEFKEAQQRNKNAEYSPF